MRLKWYYLLECLHTLFVIVFYPTIRKKSKLENLLYDEETECFEKKRIHLLKRHLDQNGKAQKNRQLLAAFFQMHSRGYSRVITSGCRHLHLL